MAKNAKRMLLRGERRFRERGGDPKKQVWLIDIGASKRFQSKPEVCVPDAYANRAYGQGFWLTKLNRPLNACECLRLQGLPPEIRESAHEFGINDKKIMGAAGNAWPRPLVKCILQRVMISMDW